METEILNRLNLLLFCFQVASLKETKPNNYDNFTRRIAYVGKSIDNACKVGEIEIDYVTSLFHFLQ